MSQGKVVNLSSIKEQNGRISFRNTELGTLSEKLPPKVFDEMVEVMDGVYEKFCRREQTVLTLSLPGVTEEDGEEIRNKIQTYIDDEFRDVSPLPQEILRLSFLLFLERSGYSHLVNNIYFKK